MRNKGWNVRKAVMVMPTFAMATALMVSVSGCSMFTPKPPEEQVRLRATERWQAAIAGDMKKVYDSTAPSYRALVSFDRFRAGFGGAVSWTGAEVVGVTCEPAVCTTVVRIDAKPLLGKGYGDVISTHFDEKWVLEQGEWWLYQQ
jgi:hypothetical protein